MYVKKKKERVRERVRCPISEERSIFVTYRFLLPNLGRVCVCVCERERERERERWDEMKIEKSDASKWDFEKVKSHCCFALQSWKIMKKTAPFLFSLNITKLNIYFHHKLDGRSKHQQLSMFDPLFDRLLLWILTTSNPSLNPTKRH